MSCNRKELNSKSKERKNAYFNRSNLVIGLTGPFGSGCSEMRKVLEKEDFGFKPFKISDDIRSEVGKKSKLIDKGKPGWRKILQDHGNEQRKQDRSYWINKVVERIDRVNIGDQNIVIDGFRNFKEIQEIRKIYPRFFLVAICAERNNRFQRVKEDYSDYNEFKNDDRRDQNEDFDWGQSVQKCVDDADYVYYNNENFFVYPQNKEGPNLDKIERILEEQANDFVPLMEGREETSRKPSGEEIQMAAAYAQSNSSTCMKRHVGSVITITRDGQEFPISMGFNENPPHLRTCLSENVCYKDEDMTAKLRAQCQTIYCPSCGKKSQPVEKPWVCECGTSFREWLHPNRNMELCTAIHAEERAILSLGNRGTKAGTLYVTTFPCFQCARLILDAEIKRVVYVEAYPVKETSEFLKANQVKVEPFTGFTARAFFRIFPKVN